MLRLPRLSAAAAAVALLAVPGCATMNVSSHVERGLDIGRYHTYDWGPADALPASDPRLDKDPFFHDHVQGEVEKGLAARGFEHAATGAPDLRIHYHAAIRGRMYVNAADREDVYCTGVSCPGLNEYEQGTLVLDIVDARSNKVIWRGWAQDSIEGVLENRDRMAKKIHEAVTRMLQMLPRPL